LQRGRRGALAVSKLVPEKDDLMLLWAKELTTKEHIDRLVEALRELTE